MNHVGMAINSSVDYYGRQVHSMNIEVSIDELFTHNIKDISIKAETLALTENKANGHIS